MKNILFNITHPDFFFSIAGPLPSRSSYALQSLGPTDIKYNNTAKELIKCSVIDSNISFCKVNCHDLSLTKDLSFKYESVDSLNTPLPIFFEQIDYTFLLKSTKSNSYSISHENKSLLSGLSEFSNDGLIISGNVNFKNNVGATVFHIKHQQKIILELEFYVFSCKLNVFHHRPIMLTEIQKLHNSLLYELIKPTHENVGAISQKITGIEWITLFYQYSKEIISLAKRIEVKNHSKIKIDSTLKKPYLIRGSNKRLLKLYNQYGRDIIGKQSKLWVDKKSVSTDTDENRYIKLLLTQLVRFGKHWISFIEGQDENRVKTFLESPNYKLVKENIAFIDKLLRNQFWNSIKLNNRHLLNKTNFGFHFEFLKLDQLCRKLKRGIKYDTEITAKAYVLPMDMLFQTWTYIKISEILGILSKSNPKAISLKSSNSSFQVSILTGKQSVVKITNDLSLQTERLFTQNTKPYRTALVNQKPDIILELINRNKLIIFDAKYKINIWVSVDDGKPRIMSYKDLVTLDISGKEVFIEPTDEDINVIHRYRDAIHFNNPTDYKHVVVKGYILFPGAISNDSLECAKEAIKKFGVGYLPIIPGIEDKDWYSQYPYDLDRTTLVSNSEDLRAVAEALFDVL